MGKPFSSITTAKRLVKALHNRDIFPNTAEVFSNLPIPISEIIPDYKTFLYVLKAIQGEEAQNQFLESLADSLEELLGKPENFLEAMRFIFHEDSYSSTPILFTQLAGNIFVEVVQNRAYLEEFVLEFPLALRLDFVLGAPKQIAILYAYGDTKYLRDTWLRPVSYVNSENPESYDLRTRLLNSCAVDLGEHVTPQNKNAFLMLANYHTIPFTEFYDILKKLPTANSQNNLLTTLFDSVEKYITQDFSNLFLILNALKNPSIFMTMLKEVSIDCFSRLMENRDNCAQFIEKFPRVLINRFTAEMQQYLQKLNKSELSYRVEGTWAYLPLKHEVDIASVTSAAQLVSEYEALSGNRHSARWHDVTCLRELAPLIPGFITNFELFISVLEAIPTDTGQTFYLAILSNKLSQFLSSKENFIATWHALKPDNFKNFATIMQAMGNKFIEVAEDHASWEKLVIEYFDFSSYSTLVTEAPEQIAQLILRNHKLAYFDNGFKCLIEIVINQILLHNLFKLFDAIVKLLVNTNELLSVIHALKMRDNLEILFIKLQPKLENLSCTPSELKQLSDATPSRCRHWLKSIAIMNASVSLREVPTYTRDAFLSELEQTPYQARLTFVKQHADQLLEFFPSEFQMVQAKKYFVADKEAFADLYKQKRAEQPKKNSQGDWQFWKELQTKIGQMRDINPDIAREPSQGTSWRPST